MAGRHLLSVRDLDLSGELEALIDAGVASFKIEGRLKDVRYIKNVVSHYRHALDEIFARRNDIVRSSVGRSVVEFVPDPQKSFTRGASEYMLYGKHSGVASFDTPKAVGEPIGRIGKVFPRTFTLEAKADLSAGDGVCVIADGELFGTNINYVEGDKITPNRMDGIREGAMVYRNYDHRFSLQLDRSRTTRTIDAKARVELSSEGVKLTVTDCEGVSVEIQREVQLELASDPQKMASTAQRQVAKSGGTIFSVEDVEVVGSEFFAPASLLSDVRREALEVLRQKRIGRKLPHCIQNDDDSARYPYAVVSRYENVTNRLAEEFYRAHGAPQIECALETKPTDGERVMISSYCIRREIGQCLKERPTLKGELYIEHGAARYKLDFDCAVCRMSLVDCSNALQKR